MVSLPNDEAKAKALLILQIEQLIAEKGLMRNFVAPEIGLTEAGLAERGRAIFEKFTIDRLRQYLAALKQNHETSVE